MSPPCWCISLKSAHHAGVYRTCKKLVYFHCLYPTPHRHSYIEPTPPPPSQKDRYEGITNLIEHPVEVEPPAEPAKPAALPIILTSKERKKLRKQRRREAEKEKQEKIQFGLIDKPEPKVGGLPTLF